MTGLRVLFHFWLKLNIKMNLFSKNSRSLQFTSENEGTADTAKILELLGLPDNVDIAKLTDEGKVDLLKLGLLYSDHVVAFLKRRI